MWLQLRRLFGRGKKGSIDADSMVGDYQPGDVSIDERKEIYTTMDNESFKDVHTVCSPSLFYLLT